MTESNENMKVISNKGTRLTGAKYLAIFSVLAWIMSIIMIKIGWFTVEEAKTILWTTEHTKWGLMTAFGIYVASETGVKAAEAYLNK